MLEFFHLILIQPLLNVLIWFYNVLPGQDMGLAIVAVTIMVRLLLYPSFSKSLKSQRELQAMQPKLEEVRKKHEGNKEAEAKAVMEFYKNNKINPFASCLPLLIQLPILISLYRVFLTGLHGDISGELYGFIADPGIINTRFLGFLELADSNFWVALVAGIFQFGQSKLMYWKTPKPKDKTAQIMSTQLTYFMPIITVVIASSLPAGLGLYWIVTTLFAIGQQYYIMRKDISKDISQEQSI
jgi:YidC/Oxa1 family membrane protein insertase